MDTMSAKNKHAFAPDYAVPPGETLHEVMGSLDMNQKELSQRTGLTQQTLIRIFKGDQPISYETANRLELVTGVPARFWNNLESLYREQLAKLAERQKLKANINWLKTIPTKELTDRGFVEPNKDKVVLLRNTLAFYGVVSTEAWQGIWLEPAIAARRSPCFESHLGAASAWIRQGEILGHKVVCQPYDKDLFKESLHKIRSLTREPVKVFEPEMKRLCARAGVAVVFVKEMKKVPWSGATKWLSPKKAMILLSLRGKREDKFWFSFFHEAGHVLNDSKKDLMINDGSQEDPREIKADKFAAEFLIPARLDKKIQSMKYKNEIIQLADELGVSSGIVAGRYQYLMDKWNVFKELIRNLKWAD